MKQIPSDPHPIMIIGGDIHDSARLLEILNTHSDKPCVVHVTGDTHIGMPKQVIVDSLSMLSSGIGSLPEFVEYNKAEEVELNHDQFLASIRRKNNRHRF